MNWHKRHTDLAHDGRMPRDMSRCRSGRKRWLVFLSAALCSATACHSENDTAVEDTRPDRIARPNGQVHESEQAELPKQHARRSVSDSRETRPNVANTSRDSPGASPEPAGSASRGPEATPEPVDPESPEGQARILCAEQIDTMLELERTFRNNAQVLYLTGRAYQDRGNALKAVEYWEKCIQLKPKSALPYIALGYNMFQQDDFDRAKSLFEKAVELSPQMPNTHFRLATVHSLMGNNAEVIVHAGKEIELNRKSFGSHRLLGDAYFQLEEYDKAREHFQTAVKINPDFAEAYYGLATLSARIGSKADSKRFREKFKSLHAKRQRSARDVRYSYNTHDALEKTRRSVARTHTEAGQIYQSHKNVKQAEKLWRRAAEIDRKNTKCRRALVSHCQGTGQLSEALRFSKQIRDCDPRNALHHLRVGDLNWQLQRHEDAAEDFNKVIELAPGRAEGYRALAQLYLQMNRDLPSVKQLAAKTTELEPTAQNFYWLSEVCNKCGDAKSRLAALQRASELAPDNPQYRRAYQLAKKGK